MENNIKVCFTLFVNYLRTHGGLKDIPEYDVDKISLDVLTDLVDVLYMKYLTSSYGLSSTSTVPSAYNHLINMIDKKNNSNNSTSINLFDQMNINQSPNLTDKTNDIKQSNPKVKWW